MSETAKENVNEIQCPMCGEKINAAAKKCRYCGEILDPALRMIMDMEKKSAPKVNIVVGQGGYADNSTPYASCPKERITYILLGIFLGGLGVHNFYAGYSGRGISQLLISLLIGWLVLPLVAVWIWVIIEVCTVDKDADGNPFKR